MGVLEIVILVTACIALILGIIGMFAIAVNDRSPMIFALAIFLVPLSLIAVIGMYNLFLSEHGLASYFIAMLGTLSFCINACVVLNEVKY